MPATAEPVPFEYLNLSGRRPGRIVRIGGRVMPGIARVQADVEPFAAAWRRANLAALDPEGPHAEQPLWVALGDSLTMGIGASAHDHGWVGRVQRQLARSGHPHRLVNLGVSGARTVDLLERQLPVLESMHADLVTVMVGSNDLMRPRNRRVLVERFAEMVERLPSGAVVTTLPNPSAVAGQVNQTLLEVARRRGLVVADLRDARLGSWRGRLAADRFHPNDAGYAAMAEVIGETVGAAVGRRPDVDREAAGRETG